MSFNMSLVGSCPKPFYDASLIEVGGGSVESRVCLPSTISNNGTCCLPCPVTQWIFDDNVSRTIKATAVTSIVSLVSLTFILASFMALPKPATRRNTVKVNLVVSAAILNIGFIVPYACSADACADPITPNDTWSSVPCAFSGFFVLFGGFASATWVLIAVCYIHADLCWNVRPNSTLKGLTQYGGWFLILVLPVAATSTTGSSFRFGPGACHINHIHAFADFWIWLILIASIAVVVQLATLAYLLNVYIRHVWEDADSVTSQSDQASKGTLPVHLRIREALAVQWREMVIVTIMMVDVTFFAVTFIYLDQRTDITGTNVQRATPWIECLLQNSDAADSCRLLAQDFLIKQSTFSAVLLLLSTIGIALFLLLAEPSCFTAWKLWLPDLLRR